MLANISGRAVDQNDIPSVTNSWPTKDVSLRESPIAVHLLIVVQIIYVAIVGTVMLAALLEWFLWLAAFLYCLCKVFKKAENRSTKVLATFTIVLFTALRYTDKSTFGANQAADPATEQSSYPL